MPRQDLKAAELFKDNQPQYLYRRKLFLDKLDDQSPFTLTLKAGGGEVVFEKPIPSERTQIGNIFKSGNKSRADKLQFISAGNAYVLEDLKKTKEFGGGGKAGSTEDTKTTENMQAVYLSLRYKLAKPNYTDDELLKVGTFSGDLTAKQVVDKKGKLADPEAWHSSSIVIAEAIRKDFGGSGWTFRRGDQWVKKIYREFSKLNAKMDKVFSQGDKWNPADIWMTKGAPAIPSRIQTLLELNVWLEEMYENGTIIGISLKQNKTGRATLEDKNFTGYKPATYNFAGYSIGKQDYHQSKYNLIYYDGGKNLEHLQLRTVPAFVCEVQGPNYRIGKITYSNSTSPLGRRVVKFLNTNDVPNYDTALTKFRASNQEIRDTIMKDFYETYKSIVNSPPPDDNNMHNRLDSEEEFYEKVEQKAKLDGTYKISKYLGFKILSAITNASEEERNDFISSVVQYAKSESELSSVHLVAK